MGKTVVTHDIVAAFQKAYELGFSDGKDGVFIKTSENLHYLLDELMNAENKKTLLDKQTH